MRSDFALMTRRMVLLHFKVKIFYDKLIISLFKIII